MNIKFLMQTLRIWNKLRHHWWGQPLLLSLLLLPIAGWFSLYILHPEGKLYLIYLPLAFCFSFLMAYDWRALPGCICAIFVRYIERTGLEITLIITMLYLVCISFCWWCYRSYTQRRWCAAFTDIRTIKHRMFWLVLCPPLLFIGGLQLLIALTFIPDALRLMPGSGINLHTLVNFQSLLLGCLSAGQLMYFIVRMIKTPSFTVVLFKRIRKEMDRTVRPREVQVWLILLAFLLFMLSYRSINTDALKVPDYCLTLLLPIMLYSAMRFGYHFSCIVWAIVLLMLFFNYPEYALWNNLLYNLTMILSMLLVFTLSILLTSIIQAQQRQDNSAVRKAALQDPLLKLPNLRALQINLNKAPCSTLYFLRIADSDGFGRDYGMQSRICFNQKLATALRRVLDENEEIYHLPGYDLVLRFNGTEGKTKISEIRHQLDYFRSRWNGLPIHPSLGLSYCVLHSQIKHLNLLLHELRIRAEVSLKTEQSESVQTDHYDMQYKVKRKATLLHGIQTALDNNSFVLMVQPIVGHRGDIYYEVQLNLCDDEGNNVPYDEFMLVAHEFGLTYRVDLWVLDSVLHFADKNRESLPSIRFAFSLSPFSLCRPSLYEDILSLLNQYRIEPYQLFFEVVESPLMQEVKYVKEALQALHALGCRVTLNEFGTGYASYNRLKEQYVDTIKIAGHFIRNMVANRVDYQIISSICNAALMQRLSTVAASVETAEQHELLKDLGVDYMQGSFISQPQPLTSLLLMKNSVTDKPV